MNLKKMHKKIIGVAFLVLALGLFGPLHVFAEETLCPEDKPKPDSSSIGQRYGFTLAHVGGSQYKVSMTNGCAENVTFNITKINGSTSAAGVGSKVSCTTPVTLTVSGSSTDSNTGLPSLIVELKSNEKVKDAPKVDDSCWWQYAEGIVSTTMIMEEEIAPVTITQPEIAGPTIESAVINCDNNTYQKGNSTHTITAGSFEDKFCIAKRGAQAAGNTYDFGSGKYSGNPKEFVCESDFKNHPEMVPVSEAAKNDLSTLTAEEREAYFVNKQYLYGESKMTESAILEYHYAPSYTGTKKISCEVTCKEAVEVEYGPPVAAVGGVCFEYIVRVTSRVSCNMSKMPSSEGLCKKNVCTPTPHCVHNGGGVYTQGGPSEAFDACVRSCDGGKYTKKCSNKCYQQIYGGRGAKAKVNGYYSDELFASKIKQWGNNYSCDGYYDKSSANGSISWVGGDSPGRWYCNHRGGWPDSGHPANEYSTSQNDGFFRRDTSSIQCNDTCSWIGCSGDVYLNSDSVQSDCDENTRRYNELVASCKAKAICNTTASTFKVHVDYTKLGETTVTPLDFPYKSSNDFIQNSGSSVTSTQNQRNTTLLYNYPDSAEGMYGCYKNGAPELDLYRATWGFPGSWMNLKTGEISYNPDGKDNTVWLEHPHRFCIPGDAKGVNVLWYQAYMHREYVVHNISESSSVTEQYVIDNCHYTSTTHSITQYSIDRWLQDVGRDNVKYNITASTRKFGYMEWDIDVKCFYAVNDDPLCGNYHDDICETSTTVEPNCIPNPEEYRVHTVDLTDMFPNESGGTLNDPSKAGRSYVGWNWSKYAINNKNPGYKSNPPAYLAKIQSNANSMYSDSNLDYEFYLSPQTIRTMRSLTTGSSSNYTAFSDSGFKLDENGISRYESAKIRDTSIFDSANSKVPGRGTKAISCNNMINWQNTSACDTVHG